MKRALIVLVVIAAILAALYFALQTKEGPIQLAYIFKAGQVDKYKTSQTVKMDASGFFGGGPSTQRMTMITAQKVLKVNQDGSARIEFDARVIRGGHGALFQSGPMPEGSFALTVTKTGKPVDMKEFRKLIMNQGGMMPGLDSMPSSNFGVGIVLPDRGVGIGQTWTDKTPFPMGGGDIIDTATLVADNYKLGSRRVCKIEHKYEGKIDLAELGKSISKRMMPFDISGEMTLTGTGTVYFSREEGKVVRSTDNGKIVMKMTMGKAPGSGGSSTGAAMTMEMVAETKSTTNLVEKRKGI